MKYSYYHFYRLSSDKSQPARRMNIPPARSVAEARQTAAYYCLMDLPTQVFISQSDKSPDTLDSTQKLYHHEKLE